MREQVKNWRSVSIEHNLYRYQLRDQEMPIQGQPILMVHGTMASHRSWGKMASNLMEGGASHIYAVDLPEVRDGGDLMIAMHRLEDIISIIQDNHPESAQLILMGFGAGGLLIYRYWQYNADTEHISTIIMLATPHKRTMFPILGEAPFHSIEQDEHNRETINYTDPIDFNRITAIQERSSTILINIYGDGVGQNYDGVVRGLNLPEAINFCAPVRHEQLSKNPEVGQFILECLRGKRYQLKLKLVGMQVRRADKGNLAGPVAFEIEGIHSPPDTVFQPIAERMYLFEEGVPPLCTLSYSTKLVSANITLHLRDLSNQSGRRRRMYTRLHVPLADHDSTAHTMQDSEGSDFLWRIVCKRLPTLLGPTWYDDYAQSIIRGI